MTITVFWGGISVLDSQLTAAPVPLFQLRDSFNQQVGESLVVYSLLCVEGKGNVNVFRGTLTSFHELESKRGAAGELDQV